MDVGFLEKLEKSEWSRLVELKKSNKDKVANPTDWLKNKTVRETIEHGSQAFVSGFANPILPNTLAFSERTFVEICPTCPCNKSPKLLGPYLEKGLVVPILISAYNRYSPDFIEELLAYPHISDAEFNFIRHEILAAKANLLSEGIVKSLGDRCWSSLVKSHPSNLEKAKKDVQSIFRHVDPFYTKDEDLLLDLIQSIEHRSDNGFWKVYDISEIIRKVRCSQAFSLIPQATLEQIEILNKIPQDHNGVIFEAAEVRDSIMNGLKISYDPSIPIDTYLDIVSKNKLKIQSIVRNISKESDPNRGSYLSDITAEVQRINEEIQSFKGSKRKVTFDLVTNFAIQNKGSIIAGLITAASIGLSGFGLIACGGLGVGSGIATKLFSQKAKIAIPKEADVVRERISSFFEPTYERAIAKALSTDVNIIQLWHIRKKLAK